MVLRTFPSISRTTSCSGEGSQIFRFAGGCGWERIGFDDKRNLEHVIMADEANAPPDCA